MANALDGKALDQLFREARAHNGWQDRPASEEVLLQLYDLLKMGLTSDNCSPARFVLVQSPAAKARLKPCLAPGNVEKTMTAPATVIVGYDPEFYEKLPYLFPHTDARSWFVGNPELIESTAFRNGSLQGAYLILAARALGLDYGTMSAFDNEKVDAEFFPDGRIKSNFRVNLGYGDPGKLYPRAPRLTFEEACQVA